MMKRDHVVKTYCKKIIFILLIVSVMLPNNSAFAMEDNSGSVPGNPAYTEDAFYFSDQYMWKASLFVAKKDTVYLKDGEEATMEDFYRIGDDAVYISPVSNWDGWMAGKRPKSPITQTYYSKDNKVDTLLQLKNNGNNVELLPNVELTTQNNVNGMVDPDVPKVPQLSDGDVYDNGVIVKDPNMVGNITKVKEYFTNEDNAYNILNYFASKQGMSAGDYMKTFTFTINGETRSDWNPAGILPNAAEDTNNDGSKQSNTTSQVQWLVVYEPVSIVYVKDTSAPYEAYYGYALSATDYAVMQVKHQMDWRYDETRWSAWAGQQPDAWKSNDDRQHVSRLAFLLMGNAVITEKSWYGLEKSQDIPDANAGVPNNRWKSDSQIRYGGWGMARLKAPVATGSKPSNQDYRPDTDIIYSCKVFSNKQAGDGGEDDKITVTYTINGETFTDKVTAPVGAEATSYFKWHTPNVTETTVYDLNIKVSPYPEVTIGNVEPLHGEETSKHGGNEYVNQKITVRAITEVTPPDPKVDDKMATDFDPNKGVPEGNDSENESTVEDMPEVKSIEFVTAPPYYKDGTIKVNVTTNGSTDYINLFNKDKNTTAQLTDQSVGQGTLESMTRNVASKDIVWTLTINAGEFGVNHYVVTPTNTIKGSGEGKPLEFEVSIDPDEPTIFDVIISPIKAIYTLYEEVVSTPLFYDVYFKSDAGTVIDTQNIEYNKPVPRPATPSKEGNTFEGWYKDPGYAYLWDFDNDKVMGTMTLYAKWSINTYTVNFDTLGSADVISPITAQYGKTIIQPLPNPVRTGYNFLGWYEDNGCTKLWNFGVSTVTSDMTLYAKWEPVSCIVSYNSQGGSLIHNQVAAFDSLITAPTPPEREGFAFFGWYKDPGCTSVWTWATDRVQGNTTLYAKWETNQYVVTFDSMEGSAVPSVTIQYDTLMPAPGVPTRDGYTFAGWFREESYSNEWNFATNKVSKDMTLYAKWIPSEATIEFESNGGTTVAKLVGLTGQELAQTTMPGVEKDGHLFNGWYKESEFSGDVITSLPETFPPGNTKYYASWQINQYLVTFEENGGNELSDLTQDYDTLIAEPIIARSGYLFEGWYLDAEYDEQWDFVSDKLTESITLYAKWNIDSYNVTFEENSGSPVGDLTIEFGSLVPVPTLERYGFTLDGWYSDAALTQPWDFSTNTIQNHTTLYAKWTETTYRLPDLFVDINLSFAAMNEMNKRPERLVDPIVDVFAKVVTQIDLDYVTSLDVGSKGAMSIEGIDNLKNLTTLLLNNNALTTLPDSIGSLTHLKTLNLSTNVISALPETLWNLTELETLYIMGNQLTELSPQIDNLSQLKTLGVSYNQITTLPDTLWYITGMERLYINNNQLTSLGSGIGNMTKLVEVDMANNQLTTIPNVFHQFTQLTFIGLGSNQLTQLPTSLLGLTTLKTLLCDGNNLTQLPAAVGNLSSLESLWCGDNQLTVLPDSIGNLSALKELICYNNQLTSVPVSIGNLANLSHLSLQNNPGLNNLPASMGNMVKLRSLNVTDTLIDHLPLSMQTIPDLIVQPSGLPFS